MKARRDERLCSLIVNATLLSGSFRTRRYGNASRRNLPRRNGPFSKNGLPVHYVHVCTSVRLHVVLFLDVSRLRFRFGRQRKGTVVKAGNGIRDVCWRGEGEKFFT